MSDPAENLVKEKERLQGVWCCPGVRLQVEAIDVDQIVTHILGSCPKCGAKWSITKEEGD